MKNSIQKKILTCFFTLLFAAGLTYGYSYTPFKLPKGANVGKPGTYYLTSSFLGFYAPRGVKALLYIPRLKKGMKSSQRPLIVYYHGATRKSTAYKSIRVLRKMADSYGFSLLSIQNIWGLDTRRRDTSRGIQDSSEATMEIVTEIVKQNIVRNNSIYTTGTSAGGFTALCVAVVRPDLFRGVGNFKGNYYQDVMNVMLKESKEWRAFLKITDDKPNIKDLSLFFAIGGAREAKRVKKQMPEGRKYFEENLKIKVHYHTYPKEGHYLSSKNFSDFWKMVQTNM